MRQRARIRAHVAYRRQRRSGSGGWRLWGQRPAGWLRGGQSRERVRRRQPRGPTGRENGRLAEALLHAGLGAGAVVVAVGVGRGVVAVIGTVRFGGCHHRHGGVVVGHRVAHVCRCAHVLRRGRMHHRRRRAEGQYRQGDSDQDGQCSAGESHGQTSKLRLQHGVCVVYVKLHRGNWAPQRQNGNGGEGRKSGRFSAIGLLFGAFAAWGGRTRIHRSKRTQQSPRLGFSRAPQLAANQRT